MRETWVLSEAINFWKNDVKTLFEQLLKQFNAYGLFIKRMQTLVSVSCKKKELTRHGILVL